MLNANHGNLSHHHRMNNMDLALDILPHGQATELGLFRKCFEQPVYGSQPQNHENHPASRHGAVVTK